MKKLKTILSVLVITSVFYACEQQYQVEVLPTDAAPKAEVAFVEVNIPAEFKSEQSGDMADEATVEVTLTTVAGKKVTGQLRFVMPQDGKLQYLAVSSNLLEEVGFTPDSWTSVFGRMTKEERATATSRTRGEAMECAGSQDEKARVNCKAGAWTKALGRVAEDLKANCG